MPEFRKDPIVDRWIIVSTERGQRPSDVQLRAGIPRLDGCPFCPNREAMTPPEVLTYRPCQSAPDTPGWTVRVVPNQYPAVRMEGVEVWVLPQRHDPAFERACGETFSHLAAVVQAVLRRAVDLLSDPPYNMIWHSAPWGDDCDPYYHWHREITPRLTRVAGFEWRTGFYINPMPPEEAARAAPGFKSETRLKPMAVDVRINDTRRQTNRGIRTSPG